MTDESVRRQYRNSFDWFGFGVLDDTVESTVVSNNDVPSSYTNDVFVKVNTSNVWSFTTFSFVFTFNRNYAGIYPAFSGAATTGVQGSYAKMDNFNISEYNYNYWNFYSFECKCRNRIYSRS